MAFDAHKNLAISTVTTATGAAGTTLGVTAGEGARFPAVPFQATVWPFDQAPTPANAEVVRVTARTTDSLTITRAQEGTTARAIVVGDLIAATITAKSLTDIESGTNFPLITTPGAISAGGHLSGAADVVFTTPGTHIIRTSSLDGADADVLQVTASGAGANTRGAYFNLFGNEVAGSGGAITLGAGDAPNGMIEFVTGAFSRGRMFRSGAFSWGSVFDPGGSTFHHTSSGAAVPNFICLGVGVGQNFPITFQNANGQVGYIGTLASATTYATTSDARLKTDRGRHTDPDVLRRTIIHKFHWTSDGTPGRGVFAQEAHAVAPFAVTVGTDDVDDQGRLKNPWGVDYSKYVPDLITGWQEHEARLAALERQPSIMNRMAAALTALWVWVTA